MCEFVSNLSKWNHEIKPRLYIHPSFNCVSTTYLSARSFNQNLALLPIIRRQEVPRRPQTAFRSQCRTMIRSPTWNLPPSQLAQTKLTKVTPCRIRMHRTSVFISKNSTSPNLVFYRLTMAKASKLTLWGNLAGMDLEKTFGPVMWPVRITQHSYRSSINWWLAQWYKLYFLFFIILHSLLSW